MSMGGMVVLLAGYFRQTQVSHVFQCFRRYKYTVLHGGLFKIFFIYGISDSVNPLIEIYSLPKYSAINIKSV